MPLGITGLLNPGSAMCQSLPSFPITHTKWLLVGDFDPLAYVFVWLNCKMTLSPNVLICCVRSAFKVPLRVDKGGEYAGILSSLMEANAIIASGSAPGIKSFQSDK